MSLPETCLFIFSLPHPHGSSRRAGASLFLGSPVLQCLGTRRTLDQHLLKER